MLPHKDWFKTSGATLQTTDGHGVQVVEYVHTTDNAILSSWAIHFRNHYIKDEELDESRASTGLSRADYLRQLKFPDTSGLGASTRSADFSEILVADYLQYLLQFIVPRTRYCDKGNRNASPMGTDILGFKIIDPAKPSDKDKLITCEVKAALVAKNDKTFFKALKDCKKDIFRKAEALNGMRQRLKFRKELDLVKLVERFQNQTDRPYTHIFGAAIVHSNHTWSDDIVKKEAASLSSENTFLVVIKGNDLMQLAHQLYERACNEA